MYERHKSFGRVEWQLRAEVAYIFYVRAITHGIEQSGQTTPIEWTNKSPCLPSLCPLPRSLP
jgi:hypothetical protein